MPWTKANDNVPAGWVKASVVCYGTEWAIQLIHESVMGLPTPMAPTINDQPGWVRGVGPTETAALADAIGRAGRHPPYRRNFS